MKTKLKWIILIVLVLAGAFVVYYYVSSSETSAAGTLVSEKVTLTTIATTISATGSLEPVDQVEVGTQVSGDVSKIYVDFNDNVKKGQVIAEIDKSKLQATLYQAQIAYESAKNDYQHKLKTFERTQKLAETNSASVVDLETAEYEKNAAQFSMNKSASEVKQAQLNVGYCIIKSPINGVVLERSVDVGQTVAASMSTPTLFILARDLKQMKVMADVDEADIGAVKKGQRVEFTVDAFPEEKFRGAVQEVRLNPTETSNVITYTVAITAENPELKLLPGMTATCTIVTEEIVDAISVPVKAIKFTPTEGTPMLDPKDMSHPPRSQDINASLKDEGMGPPEMMGGGGGAPGGGGKKKSSSSSPKITGSHVWVSINGKAAPRPVKTGISDGVNVQIIQGLVAGDSVVVSQTDPTEEKKTVKKEASSPFMPTPGKKNR